MSLFLKNKNFIDPIKKIQSFLANELKLVDQVIKYRAESREEAIPIISEYIFSSGGKRIRPILTILSAKLFGYQGDRHINLAAAVEFIHTATLLHDDVVDESSLRRGKPSANNKWDNKTSVLVGDYLFSQAFCIMAQDGDTSVLDILAKTSAIIAEGEVMQISSKFNLNVSQETYFEIVKAKTAELFAAACHVGAAICKRSVEDQIALRKFGTNLGIAFQIMDDALDYAANELILGKSIGDDFREGKVTLPILLAYQKSNDSEKEFFQRTFVNMDQAKGDFDESVKILKKYDIIAKSKKIAHEYIEKAKQSLEIIPESQAKSFLLEILEFSSKRSY